MSVWAARAIVFVDGANLYSCLKASGIWANRIDPYKVAKKLVEHRTLVEVRYYIAEIQRTAPERVYRAFRELMALLDRYDDVRICTGHIQAIQEANPCAHELSTYLATMRLTLPISFLETPTSVPPSTSLAPSESASSLRRPMSRGD